MRTSPRSKRTLRTGVLGICMALVATACGTAAETAAPPAEPATEQAEEVTTETGGAGLPQLVGDTVRGSQLDTNDLEGQDVVVWFWAPW